jgi:5,5'-dehydrodivanillate O-demethylase
LRCSYHGWLFDGSGSCLEQPNQHPESIRLKERSKIVGYPVQVMGGLVFAYLGPDPVPALPRFDLFDLTESGASFRDIGYAVIPFNWLQIMENSFDPTHVEWLHGRYFNYQLERKGEPLTALGGHHVKLGFDLVDYGIIKRRLREGQSEDSDDWRIGHPVVFPNLLKIGGKGFSEFQIRVPIDDQHTMHYYYCWYDLPDVYADLVEEARAAREGYYPVLLQDDEGTFLMDTIDSQDAMVWVTQGARATRDGEHLSSSDQGIALYRNLLRSQLALNESGGDVMNVYREDPGVFDLPMENKDLGIGGGSGNPLTTYMRTQSRFSPRVNRLLPQIDERLASAVPAGR